MTQQHTDHYSHLPRHYVAVDCIIFAVSDDRLKVLLVRRNFEPEKGKWSLIGGFVDEGESVEQAARRVLHTLTGLENVFIRQVGAFGRVDRDPGARVISVAYFALLNLPDVNNEVVSSHKAQWVDVDTLPTLGFDHREMIEKALLTLRRKIMYSPMVFNLMPTMFTLTQMQHLVETVSGETLDKRNFRKRVTELPYVKETELIDKQTSKRGARLYTYTGSREE